MLIKSGGNVNTVEQTQKIIIAKNPSIQINSHEYTGCCVHLCVCVLGAWWRTVYREGGIPYYTLVVTMDTRSNHSIRVMRLWGQLDQLFKKKYFMYYYSGGRGTVESSIGKNMYVENMCVEIQS